jgi:very-short-patch-repair endonuclease
MQEKKQPKEPILFFGAPGRIFEYARQNREKPTPAEAALWAELSGKKIKGLRFRRQHPIGVFIVDFYSHAAKLAIEIDGAYHFEANQMEYDQNRTALLQEVGIREIRFTNEAVLGDVAKVLEVIVGVLEEGGGV